MKKLIEIDMSNVNLSKEAQNRQLKRQKNQAEKLSQMKQDYLDGKFDNEFKNL